MGVYEEYVKAQPGDKGPEPQLNGTENLNPSAEEVKDAEA